MKIEALQAVEDGATVLTASRRLARDLSRQYNSWQRDQGRSVWKTPDILPLESYLRRCWLDWTVAGGESDTLLGAAQEQAVWEQVIRESEGDCLLRIPETAQAALKAWKLARAYRLPMAGQFEASEDCAAFLRWTKEFQKRCEANNWMEEAQLPDFMAELLRGRQLARPAKLFVAGFDELTPQQADLLDALSEREEFPRPQFESVPQCFALRDSTEEIQAAARWARNLLDRDPDARIGVVVAGLSTLRSQVERVFREELHAAAIFDESERAFHLSLGRPLNTYPIVHAALLLLEFALASMPLPRVGTLLRSPFLGGSEKERNARAAFDAKLRKHGVWNVSLKHVQGEAAHCPDLQRRLRRVQKEMEKLSAGQHPSEWSRGFSRLLKAFGWPGERPLSSQEHQIVEAWNGVLSTFATLDAISAPLNFDSALTRLRTLASETPFQVKNEGAPVQIMGLFEASGLSFDRLWVMGLHDEALPGAALPNPFLPLRMQQERKLPHSSPERELEFAGKTLARLLASAPDVVLSYPMQDGERRMGPTPLGGGTGIHACVELACPKFRSPGRQGGDTENVFFNGAVAGWLTIGAGIRNEGLGARAWASAMRRAASFESLTDEAGPAWTVQAGQKGGASLFRDMAACPFRAFIRHRVGARALDDAKLGLDARGKGTLVHKALELIWGDLRSHEQLNALSRDALAELVSRHVEAALDQKGGALGSSLEQIRLERLLLDWLQMEKIRPPFVVLQPESDRPATVGGIPISVRMDRVDQLPDGRQIILDYKTGEVKGNVWTSERPVEPQVPLYCIASDTPVAGAALAQIRAGDLRFRGVDESGSLPNLTSMRTEDGLTLALQIDEWRRVLNGLGERFRAGNAEVNPSRGACEFCDLTALCRIREIESD